ncbi:hypothetical protein GCM10023116_40520 [Kistimonas scapharcae]|uniref:Uncharacterized protein n=1 Tax=Kistimonas scapharcae TaxID=1036133 RepID=A0ABP8V687_9GAMM
MDPATSSTQKQTDKYTVIAKREHHSPPSINIRSTSGAMKLQRSHSFPKQLQLLYREISTNNVTFILSHTSWTIKHGENQNIIYFPFNIKIGNLTFPLHRIKFEERDERLIEAIRTLSFCPEIQIKHEPDQNYSFPIKPSYNFSTLLKNGTTFLKLDANKFNCFDFIIYLKTGQEDLRCERFTLTKKCPLIRSQDNTGKSIVLSHDEQIHAALVISPTELTVSYLGRKGLFFCRLGDLIELYQQHEGKPLEVHELTISMKAEG